MTRWRRDSRPLVMEVTHPPNVSILHLGSHGSWVTEVLVKSGNSIEILR